MKRINFSSGAPLEEMVGYSRMVKVGEHIYIGGTTAVLPDGTVHGDTALEQADYIFRKFINLLNEAGANASDVIKIKAYVTDMSLQRKWGKPTPLILKKSVLYLPWSRHPNSTAPLKWLRLSWKHYN